MEPWLPIGPSAVLKGQATGRPLVSGRVTGIAPLPDGTVYICTANGGVWKSSDAGRTWISKMEGFNAAVSGVPASPLPSDVQGTGADSLACGAIAVAPGAGTGGQDRVYVGSGEGYRTNNRYFGAGLLVSDEGGRRWQREEAVPALEQNGFCRLAIDPTNAQHVFAATFSGLYERVPADPTKPAGSTFVWKRITGLMPDPGAPCCGLALASAAGVTHVYAAFTTAFFTNPFGAFGVSNPVPMLLLGVYHGIYASNSNAGSWSFAGDGLNPTNPSVTVLAMQPGNPQVVYALVSAIDGFMAGVYRLDTSQGASAAWLKLSDVPPDLFGTKPKKFDPKAHGQGRYDIALAVDPTEVNRIYLGGSATKDGQGAALFRCSVMLGKSNFLTCEPIGARVHADIHAIEFEPGNNPRTLWVGCDGGVYVTDNALGDRKDDSGKAMPTAFVSRNLGLSTLQVVRLGMHPTEDGVLFAGTQDNGLPRYTGEELWLRTADGDGGAVLVNTQDSLKLVQSRFRDNLAVASDGGQSPSSWSAPVGPPNLESGEQVAFSPPLIALPLDDANAFNPHMANRLAFGSERVWISTDFGNNWKSIPSGTLATDSIDGRDGRDHSKITALAWQSSPSTTSTIPALKLYAGTEMGTIARYDWDPTADRWTRRIIHTPPKNPPSGANIGTTVPPNPITSITVADSAGDSIYIVVGGQLGAPYMRRARVWLGTDPGAPNEYTWQPRSGPGDLADPTPASPEYRLMDIHHSVVIVDPQYRNRLYVGADLGVWRSDDGGQKWYAYSVGIPEAAVTDLKLHPKRTLWASTYGRGVYEISADADPSATPTPYLRYLVRDTHLDVGRGPSAAGAVDPTGASGEKVAFGHSPDVRIDTPAKDGTYSTLVEDINPAQFLQVIGDEMKAYRPKTGGPVDNRVYVQVHQRGTAPPNPSDSVQVMLLLAPGKTPPALPAGYTSNVQSSTAISSGDWTTVGTMMVNNVGSLMPRIAHFRLSSASLAGHDDWCLLVLLHAAADTFTSSLTDPVSTYTGTDVQTICARSRLAAWSHVSVVETTRATSGKHVSFFAEILDAIGLGALVAQDDQAAPRGAVDA